MPPGWCALSRLSRVWERVPPARDEAGPEDRRQARADGVRRGTGGARRAPARGGPGVDDHRARAAPPAQSPGRPGTGGRRPAGGRGTRHDRRPGRPRPCRPGQTAGRTGRERGRDPQAGAPRSGTRGGTGASGATTVSATASLAALAGIRVFATGGLGGVHREWTVTQDESADLGLLARTRITVVCAGVKSILDVPATLQRLETLGVAVAGYRTDRFPGFYLSDSGHTVDWSLESPAQVAEVMRAQDTLRGPQSALVVANPVPREEQLDPSLHARVLADALQACEEAGITGQAVTPFLLDHLVRHTDGASLSANLAAVRGTYGSPLGSRRPGRRCERGASRHRGRGHGRRRPPSRTARNGYGHGRLHPDTAGWRGRERRVLGGPLGQPRCAAARPGRCRRGRLARTRTDGGGRTAPPRRRRRGPRGR